MVKLKSKQMMFSSYFKLRLLKRRRMMNTKNSISDVGVNEHQSAEINEKKCRICLNNGCIPIYSVKDCFEIPEAIQIFGDIEISKNDDYPKFLCQSCYRLLQGAIKFRETAKASDKLLKVKQNVCLDDDNFEIDTNDQPDYEQNNEIPEKSYYCNICKLKFDCLNKYILHKNSKLHKNTRVQCSICQGVFTSHLYKKHLARHNSESHLVCEVCGKVYRKDNLLRHLQLHSFDLPYQCQVCPYRGRFLESLKTHMRSHTGDKPFSCDKCKLCFLTRSNLNRHLLIHNKEKPHKCIECNRGFYTKRDMDGHFKSDHAGVKDFVCKLCGNKYGTRKALMRHELRVHKRTKMAKGRMPLYLQAEYRKSDVTEIVS